MSERVDFSGNANVYDRRHGAALNEGEVRRLALAGAVTSSAKILDIGAGTGRVAIPLSELGCDVCAVEPAAAMLEALRAKGRNLPIRLVAGEGARLPVSDARFDVVIVARLLYLTADWRDVLREARRVLAIGGRLLHEWGNGEVDEEWVQIREKARALFEEAGVSAPFHPGVRSEGEVDETLERLGLVRTTVVHLGPGPSVTLSEFLRRLVTGELSYTWSVPKDVQTRCLPLLAAWSAERFDLERSIPMPRNMRWAVYGKTLLRPTPASRRSCSTRTTASARIRSARSTTSRSSNGSMASTTTRTAAIASSRHDASRRTTVMGSSVESIGHMGCCTAHSRAGGAFPCGHRRPVDCSDF